MFNEYPDIVSVAQLQKMLNIGKNSAYSLINKGKIKSIRIGNTYKICKAEILKYVKIK